MEKLNALPNVQGSGVENSNWLDVAWIKPVVCLQSETSVPTAIECHSSGARWKSRWTSWAPVPNKLTVSVDVKQHFNNNDRIACIVLSVRLGTCSCPTNSSPPSEGYVDIHFHSHCRCRCIWSLLCSAILHSRADSLHSCCVWLYVSECISLRHAYNIHPSAVFGSSHSKLLPSGSSHSKLLPSRRIVCTPYNHAPYRVTSCKATYVGCMRV